MKNFFISIGIWIRSWDFMAILYAVIGAAIVSFILWWAGAFRKFFLLLRQRKGLALYIKDTREFCSTLVVIGQRKGFTTREVFIPLDIAQSDFSQQSIDRKSSLPTKYVLIGGPGAGKSTYVKKLLLDALQGGETPILIRLRDYLGVDTIENYLAKKLETYGVPNAIEQLGRLLSTPQCLCVLDGLDEVRPKDRDKVSEHINNFYTTFFSNNQSARFIVTCRKEAYRTLPLVLPEIWEVRPLTDEQILRFAKKWPPGYPKGKSPESFCRDLSSAPKIMELARSPLLLVGGLMQYTESNLGIPEERYEYLARIARWLIVDWAVAQELPPDPFRQTYDRIIPRIAFHLHMSQVSECDLPEAEKLIQGWLPDYGHSSSDASQVLDGILTRTGILVRDASGAVVFSQLSLQEYFASTRLIQSVGIEKLPDLEPLNWWREVILLSVAQEKEPTPCLDLLFIKNPLLAAAAVGECPTPSLFAQQKACELAIAIIDRQEEGSSSSIVPLIRKLRTDLEGELCAKLEERLVGTSSVSSTVANILATAGTPGATKTLANHPEAWDKVLLSTSYLSASFENLLVDWIRDGSEAQSHKAVELISQRLSKDRFRQLVDILPILSPQKQCHLAMYLLRAVEASVSRWYGAIDRTELSDMAKCVAFVQDSSVYMSMYKPEEISSKSPFNSSPVPACLHVQNLRSRTNHQRLLSMVVNSLSWSRQRPVLLAWVASCVSVLSLQTTYLLRELLLCGALACFLGGVIVPGGVPPWVTGIRYRSIWRPLSLASYILIGISFHNSLIRFFSGTGGSDYSIISTLLLSMAFLLGGLATSNERWYYRMIELLPGYGSFRRWIFLGWIGILLLFLFDHWFLSDSLISLMWPRYLSILFTAWILFESTRLLLSWYQIKKGAIIAAKRYPAIQSHIYMAL